MRKTFRLTLIALSLAGCITSSVLVWLSANVGTSHALLGTSLCGAGEHINCDAVLSSDWAHIGAIPLAHLGLVYFVALALWFIIVGLPNRAGRFWHLVPLIIILIGAAISAWLTYVMIARLPTLCPWCLAAHIINGLLLITTLLAWPRQQPASAIIPPAAYPSGVRAGITLASIGAGTVIMTLAALVYVHSNASLQCQRLYRDATNNIDYLAWRWQSAPLQEIPVRSTDFTIGHADAPHTLVVFSDFECSGCAQFFSQAEPLVSQFPKDLRCVFKHYPLTTTCNPYAARSMHIHACEAALAAEAAASITSGPKLREYYALLYTRSGDLAQRPYEQWAQSIGLDSQAFAKAMASSAATDKLRVDIELGHRLGVEGTPTMFLDGRRMSGWQIIQNDTTSRRDVAKTISFWEHLLNAKALMNQQSKPQR